MSTTKPMTVDEFAEAIHFFYKDQRNKPEREFVVYTGISGMNQINEEVKNQVLKRRRDDAEMMVTNMWTAGLVNDQELDNLYDMIASPDLENLVIVESIIDQHEQRRIPAPELLSTSRDENETT